MLELELTFEDGRTEYRRFALPLSIGRAPECALSLRSWRVARHHALIQMRGEALYLEDLGGLAGSHVNGRRVAQYGPLLVGDEIVIGPCRARILKTAELTSCAPRGTQGDGEPDSNLFQECETAVGHNNVAEAKVCGEFPRTPQLQPAIDQLNRSSGAIQVEIRLQQGARPGTEPNTAFHHRRRLHKALLEALDLRRRDILALSDEALRMEASEALSRIIADDGELPPEVNREQLLKEIVDEAVGLGPIETLLADPTVSEIMVNAHDEIFVERSGTLQRLHRSFTSDQAVRAVIDRIVAPLGRRVDESSPMVDARLKDGSRVNAVIPPVALRGPCLTIRKFPQRRLSMDDLLAAGSLDANMAQFLSLCVKTRKSILVSGGTGSGKTTLLNILSNCIPEGERVITIEDAAELKLHHEHLVSMESRPPNTEGKGKIEIRDLVRNALRMRPDRIIVGECRGAEAFDMLAAMNTGHEGSLTTLHANSPRDALSRLETMILMAGMDLPLAAIREHIAAAIDLIVQQARLSDGRRLVVAIVEVTGMEAGRIQTQDLFSYRQLPSPRFEGCGVQPECFSDAPRLVPAEWMNQVTVLEDSISSDSWPS